MYEIEIKSLLGSRENAERIEARMKELDPSFAKTGESKQLNHYFEDSGDWNTAAKAITDEARRNEFLELAEKAKDISLRTRDLDGKVILVLKAAVDDTTSANGTARREFECEFQGSIDALDKMLLDAGFKYQAKWSRDRQEFKFKGANITIDKNAGYGYLTEFEKMEADPSRSEAVKAELRGLLSEVGIEELPQDRLARMFDYYNKHWPEYYGTEKIFNIE